MATRLQDDLKRLEALAFHRREWSETVLCHYHAIRRNKGNAAAKALGILYCWMFIPITLWPFDIHQVFEFCLSRISAGDPLGEEMELLLTLLPPPPSDEVCAIVAEHERDVQRGQYEELVTTSAKFDAAEQAISLDPAFIREWNKIKVLFDVNRYRDYKGVIRRTLTGERNLGKLSVNWNKKAERFQAVFDAFCLRWNLYGMQEDKPLLMKLTVNLTAQGTMIFIPAYWSFDSKRDVRWGEVMKLHRARASKKQGPALSEGLEHRRAQAVKLEALDREVARRKLRGQKRHAFLCAGLGLAEETDHKRLARLRREFRQTSD